MCVITIKSNWQINTIVLIDFVLLEVGRFFDLQNNFLEFFDIKLVNKFRHFDDNVELNQSFKSINAVICSDGVG